MQSTASLWQALCHTLEIFGIQGSLLVAHVTQLKKAFAHRHCPRGLHLQLNASLFLYAKRRIISTGLFVSCCQKPYTTLIKCVQGAMVKVGAAANTDIGHSNHGGVFIGKLHFGIYVCMSPKHLGI